MIFGNAKGRRKKMKIYGTGKGQQIKIFRLHLIK